MNLVTVKDGQATVHAEATFDDKFVFGADSTPSDIDRWLKERGENLQAVLFNVADFKDGRIFSLIKHLRHQGYQSDIYVGGDFALDQANYFIKSGITGFIVADDKLTTLKQTLSDLQTGHLGSSANALPMFRG